MTTAKYYYNANGLNFASEIEFPEMRPAVGPTDITIRYGNVPDKLVNITYQGVCAQIAPERFLLRIDGVAKYLMEEGKEVTIEPFERSNEDDIRVFFLAAVMGAICHQRGLLPLHASAIAKEDSCILFAGRSTIGKSTLASAFHENGYHFLSDDICAVSFDHRGLPVVSPGYAQIKLWADSLKRLRNVPGSYGKLRHEINKYSIIVKENICKRPLYISKIYVLTENNSDNISLTPLRGRAKFNSIINNTYRLRLLKGLGSRQDHFELCKRLNDNVNITQASRPYCLTRLEELVNILEKDFLR